jgi:hypothetical protein
MRMLALGLEMQTKSEKTRKSPRIATNAREFLRTIVLVVPRSFGHDLK